MQVIATRTNLLSTVGACVFMLLGLAEQSLAASPTKLEKSTYLHMDSDKAVIDLDGQNYQQDGDNKKYSFVNDVRGLNSPCYFESSIAKKGKSSLAITIKEENKTDGRDRKQLIIDKIWGTIDCYLGFYMYVPKECDTESMTRHSVLYERKVGGSGYPPTRLHLNKGPKLEAIVRWGNSGNGGDHQSKMKSMDIKEGVWYKIVIRSKNDETGNNGGVMQVWVDDKLFFDYHGKVCYTSRPASSDDGNVKIGHYGSAQKAYRITLFDEVRLANTYDEADPAQGSGGGEPGTPTVWAPTISPSGGSILGPTQVELTCQTSGAEIRYTLNGNDPTSSSNLYSSALTIDQTTTIKAKAFKDGYEASDVASASFTLEQLPSWQIPVVDVQASSDDGNGPWNAVDGDLATRWSASGDPEWISFDFGSAETIERMSIAYHNGDQRKANFELQVSSDGTTWTTIGSYQSSGTTLDPEWFDVGQETRYIRYLGHGNTSNDWNSLNEVAFSKVAVSAVTHRRANQRLSITGNNPRSMYDLRGRRIFGANFTRSMKSPTVGIISTENGVYRKLVEIK